MSHRMWGELTRLANTSPEFSSLPDDIVKDTKSWKAIYDSSTPQKAALPGRYHKSTSGEGDLSPFQQLLLLRCLRPDKVLPACNDFVESTMVGPSRPT